MQGAFDFDAVAAAPTESPPAVDGPKLDAAGHRWCASLCWGKQTDMIGKAREWPEHAQELSVIAKNWKEQAEAHQAKAFMLEPETRMG